jgi:hypothetical protein
MTRAIPVLLAASVLAAPLAAGAQAPPYLPLQGVLYDDAGVPVDSDVVMTFSLYDTEIGGTALWTELQVVLVEDGFFTAYLGESTVLDLSVFRDNTDLWMGVMVEGDSEMRRAYLGSTPFSGYAEYCGNVPEHGHDFTDLTGTIDPSSLPSGLVVGAQSCSGTAKVSGVDSTGTITCTADLDTDTDTTYTSGVGLILSGTQFAVDTSVIQRRVTGTCTVDQAITAVNGDGTVLCRSVYTGDITGVTAGTGLTGGGTSGTVTLNADTTYLQRRVTGTCAAGSAIRIISSTGSVTCQSTAGGTGDITGVTAGTGLTGGGTTGTVTLNADTTYLQRRVTGTCALNQAIRAIGSTGTVTCQSVYTGDITGVTAGTGLTGGGTTGTVILNADTAYLQRRVTGTCAAGSSIRAISSTGTVTCETDDVGSGGGAITRSYAGYATSSLSTSTTYIYVGSTFTPTSAETCHVTADMTINAAAANNSMGPFFRIAVQTGGVDGNDGQFGFYPGYVVANERAAMSRSTILNLSASTTYRFGCYFGGVSGDWLSESTYCRITYICW